MGKNKEEKTTSPFNIESEDETIGLSKNELDDILSEAEIVSEKEKKESPEAPEPEIEEITVPEGELPAEALEEEEFDISGEIDELTPEDLENIELEESELEPISAEAEKEIPESPETEEELGVELADDLKGIDTEGINLEAAIDEEMDLDSYLDSVKEDIDLESIDLGEEEGEALVEPPVLGEEELADLDLEADEALKEAGIVGIEEEGGALEEEIAAVEIETGIEETAEVSPGGEEITLEEPAVEEVIIPEEPAAAGEEFPRVDEEVGVEPSGEAVEGEVPLEEEEEKILSEDFDLEAAATEEAETEDVVTLTGEELDTIGGLEEEVPAAEAGIEPVIDSVLLTDITTILQYMDTLLGDLPEEKIKEFSQSKYFSLYKEVFEKLHLA